MLQTLFNWTLQLIKTQIYHTEFDWSNRFNSKALQPLPKLLNGAVIYLLVNSLFLAFMLYQTTWEKINIYINYWDLYYENYESTCQSKA